MAIPSGDTLDQIISADEQQPSGNDISEAVRRGFGRGGR